MKKVKSKDLILDHNIQVSSSKGTLNLINHLDILIAILGVIGTIYAFISSYDIQHNKLLVVSAIIIFVLFYSFMYKNLKYLKYTLLGSMGIYGGTFLIFYEDIKKGFMATWNIVAEGISKNSKINLINFDLSIKNTELCISIFLLFVSYIICWMICYSIICKPNFILLLIFTVPILDIGLYFDNMPSYLSFTLLVITWVSVLGMKTMKNKVRLKKSKGEFKNKRKKHTYIIKGKSRAITSNVGIILGIITSIIFATTFLIYPPDSYEATEGMEKSGAYIQKLLKEVTFEEFMDGLMGIGHGGVNGGQLGTIDKIKYNNETALEVTTPYFGKDIYLKGYIGCEYTGNSWDQLSDEMYYKYFTNFNGVDGFNINALMISELDNTKEGENLENYRANISVRNVNANKKYLYVPYNLNQSDYHDTSGMTIQNQKESYEWSYDINKYSLSYYPGFSNIEKAQEAAKYIGAKRNSYDARDYGIYNDFNFEKEYRDFAYEAYTKLPEGSLDEIKKKYSGRYNETKDIQACIIEAISAINDGTTYDLAPGKLPQGKDFVEYFLYENKKGYCTHFASAATVILRAMGVPTRYVEGYVIRSNDAENATSTKNGTVTKAVNRPVTKEDIENGVSVGKITHNDGSWSYFITAKDGRVSVSNSFGDGTESKGSKEALAGDKYSSSVVISDGNGQSNGLTQITPQIDLDGSMNKDGNQWFFTTSNGNNVISSNDANYETTEGDNVVISKGDGESSRDVTDQKTDVDLKADSKEVYSQGDEITNTFNEENQLINKDTGEVITMSVEDEVSCEIKTMDIKDSGAHAWVEVYIDELGWIPIEVTPGSTTSSTESIENAIKEKKEEVTPRKETEEVNTPEENTTENKVNEEPVANNIAVDKVDDSIGLITLKVIISVMVMLIVIIVIIALRHKLVIYKRIKSFKGEDYNKNVHNVYKYLMQIYKYLNIDNKDNLKVFEYTKSVEEKCPFIQEDEFKDIMNIVFKADFSQHKTSIDEVEKVTDFTNKLNDEIYNSLTKIQKLNYKYLKNLH